MVSAAGLDVDRGLTVNNWPARPCWCWAMWCAWSALPQESRLRGGTGMRTV